MNRSIRQDSPVALSATDHSLGDEHAALTLLEYAILNGAVVDVSFGLERLQAAVHAALASR